MRVSRLVYRPSPRSVSYEEGCRALAHHADFGLPEDVWNLRSSPLGTPAGCIHSLAQRFGLSQEDLNALFDADGRGFDIGKAKASTIQARIRAAVPGTSLNVWLTRSKLPAPFPSDEYIKYARPILMYTRSYHALPTVTRSSRHL